MNQRIIHSKHPRILKIYRFAGKERLVFKGIP